MLVWLWRVPESSGVYRFRGQSSEASGEFRCGLLPDNFDRNSYVIILNAFW